MNDQITRPLDRAVWWIEHLMRHPEMYAGKSPVHDLAWYEYFLLDVILLLLGFGYILFKIIRIICKFMCCRNPSKLKNE